MIADLIFCETNGITSNFYLASSAAYIESCQISKMECFAKIANGWILLTVFTKSFILDVLISCWIRPWLSLMFLLLSIETATLNLPGIFLIWSVSYLNISCRNLLFRCNRITSETCSNLTMRNQNGVDKLILVSFLLTWNVVTCGSTVSTSDNDQVNNVGGKGTDPR